MKSALLLIFIGAAAASQLNWNLQEQVKDVKDKQQDINALFTGLGSEDLYHHVTKDFPFKDAQYYREPRALEKFMEAWEEGFLPKCSLFSLYSYKNRHDTYRLFDIFYFAKDYDTFIKMAKWAKAELHPLQFVYSFTAALYHRKDAVGVAIPHLYEALPHYYMPSDIIQGAIKANILGVNSRKFNVNTTGYEYSWYKGLTMESSKSGPKWNPYDTESRMSYYTEDTGLADFVSKFVIAYAPWLSDEKYPDIGITRKGEVLFDHHKYLLKKYNLERYANDLPPVEPLDFKFPIKTGYNSHLMTLHGYPFTPRPDGFTPMLANPEGINNVLITKKRFDDVTDVLSYYNSVNGSVVRFDDGLQGINALGELVFGSTHPQIRSMYKPYHYHALEALDTAVRPANDILNAGSVLSNFLTEMRDPLYYRVLASVYQVFKNYFTKLQPYTKEELAFPGVKMTDFQMSKLETYFEHFEYDITNSVPFNSNSNKGYEYTAVKSRLNHKPFDFKFTIDSDKEQDAMIRFFLTPSLDANNRELGIAEKVEHAVGFLVYQFKLKPGVNTYSGDSSQGFYSKQLSMKEIQQQLKSSNKPFYVPKQVRCSVPSNLIIPKGTSGGKPYTLMAVVTPYTPSGEKAHGPCNWDFMYDSGRPLDFPTDRRAVPSYFKQLDNIYFKDFSVYHTETH